MRRTSKYLQRIELFNITHMISIRDLVTIGIVTPRIDKGCTLEKEFAKLILINQ